MSGKVQCEVYGELQVKFVIPSVLALLWGRVAFSGVIWPGPDGTLPRLDQHEVIFLGELTKVESKTDDCERPALCRYDYSFRVLKVFKGKVGSEAVLSLAQYMSPVAPPLEALQGTYLMYADYRQTKTGRRLVFDRTPTSPSFIYNRVPIQDWGDILPSFDDLRSFWLSHLSSWRHTRAVKVNEPQKLDQITRDEVLRVVVQNRPKLIPCYGETFAPLKPGPLSLKYKLSSEGKVLNVLSVGNGHSSANDQIKRCFIDATKSWTFPHKSAKEAEFVLVFD
jgi:hypothetical protein